MPANASSQCWPSCRYCRVKQDFKMALQSDNYRLLRPSRPTRLFRIKLIRRRFEKGRNASLLQITGGRISMEAIRLTALYMLISDISVLQKLFQVGYQSVIGTVSRRAVTHPESSSVTYSYRHPAKPHIRKRIREKSNHGSRLFADPSFFGFFDPHLFMLFF